MTSVHDVKLYVENLIALCENADNDKERIYYVKEFGDLRLRTERVFKFLENCLVSDASYLVRSEAAKSLILTFGEMSKKVIQWSIQYEKHAFFFKTLLDLTEKSNIVFASEVKSQIFRRISEIYECYVDDAKFLYEFDSIKQDPSIMGNPAYSQFPFEKHYYVVNSENSRIVYLYLNRLEIVPESIKNLTELRSLSLFDMSLKSVPTSVKHLKQLRELNLSNNRLKKLPEWIANLHELQQIDLYNNPLEIFPNWLMKFSEQNYTDAHTSVGVTLSDATVLGVLEILGYRLKLKREEGFSVEACSKTYEINKDGHIVMVNLELRGSNTGLITEQICKLEHVEVIYLTGKPNVSLPQSIHKLKNLREFYIRAHNVGKIPHCVTKLKNLKVFDLHCVNIGPVDDETRSFLDQLKACVFQTKKNPFT